MMKTGIILLCTLATKAVIFASTETDAPITEELPITTTNSTFTENRYGEPLPDSRIQFQYDESKETGTSIWDTHVEKIIGRGVVQLALQMDYVLSSENYTGIADKSNIVFSPANIAAVLALVMLGSAGRTFTEIANVLGLVSGVDISANGDEVHYHFGRLIRKLQAHPDAEMSTYIAMAGGVFVQEGFPIQERFTRFSREIYGSEIISLNFLQQSDVAKDVINSWVENRTYGHIPNILDYPPPPSTRIILASALYFNGAWEYPFPPEQTKWKPFYTGAKNEDNTDEILQVIMMVNGGDFPYYYDTHLGCEVVGLPYKGHTSTMYLILPTETGIAALKRLQYQLTVDHLHHFANSATVRTVIITVPRMQLQTTIHLKEALKILGVTSLFDLHQANLSKISNYNPQDQYNVAKSIYQYAQYPTGNAGTVNDQVTYQSGSTENQSQKIEFRNSRQNSHANPGLYVEDVIHKVTVDITEIGTIASAASAASITRDGSHSTLRFERPFLFFIRHQATGIILFWGTVTRPEPNQPTFVKN